MLKISMFSINVLQVLYTTFLHGLLKNKSKYLQCHKVKKLKMKTIKSKVNKNFDVQIQIDLYESGFTYSYHCTLSFR